MQTLCIMANLPDVPEIGPTFMGGTVVGDALKALRSWVLKLAPAGREKVTVASAASIDLDAAGAMVVWVSGTEEINSVVLADGQVRILYFVDSGGVLSLEGDQPTGAAIIWESADCAVVVGYSGGVVCLLYQRADGTALAEPAAINPTEIEVAIGNSGTAKTLTLAIGTFQTCTLTGNCTFTMPAAVAGKSFSLHLKTGAGGFTAAFTGVKWPTAGAPTITVAASKMDKLAFDSDGTNWYGWYLQGFTP